MQKGENSRAEEQDGSCVYTSEFSENSPIRAVKPRRSIEVVLVVVLMVALDCKAPLWTSEKADMDD